MARRNPQTPEEWRQAVDSAAACRAIADCKMYGLIEGGPEINLERCYQILERGRKLGIVPSRSIMDLGIEMVKWINRE
jgi:hypothetical protein